MLSQFSLKTKLLFLCLMLSLVSAAVGVTNYYNFSYVVGQFHSVTQQNVPKVERANKMYLEFRKVRINLRTLGLEGLPADLAKTHLEAVHDAITKFDELNKEYADDTFLPGEKKLYTRVDASWQAFKQIGAKALEHWDGGTPADRKAMLQIFFYDCPRLAAAFTKDIDALTEFQEASAAKRVISAESASSRANLISLLMIVGGSIFGLTIGYLLSNSIAKELRLVAKGLADEAGLVEKVASKISSSSDDLSASTSQQAAALQETTAAVEETSAMIGKNAENAKISTDVSRESETTVEKGRQAVEQMLVSIDDISSSNSEIMRQIEDSNREISEIVKVIAEIGNKTKVINDIVFQTKLLSFNASVEAARAGEHGKGFAVVAEEVGNLAQMSGNAAKEISEMLEGSIKKVETIVQNTQSRVGNLVQVGKEKVSAGTITAKRCSEILEEIVANVGRVGSLVSEISVASQEQAKGVSEINKAMSELDNVAQQNSVASQETQASAEELRRQVQEVREYIARLEQVLTGEGQHAKSESKGEPVASRHAPKKSPKGTRPQLTTATKESSQHRAVALDVPLADDDGFSEAS
jgi:methyl-accepting chemotaxis protein